MKSIYKILMIIEDEGSGGMILDEMVTDGEYGGGRWR
jgi:hypothetical protein